jgi:hypothetical protein
MFSRVFKRVVVAAEVRLERLTRAKVCPAAEAAAESEMVLSPPNPP